MHVFRVIREPDASRADFLSDRTRGKHPRDVSPEALRRHEGFSVWTSEERARAIAQRFPRLGTHIAELELPEGARLEPFRDTPDHQTAYGDPDAFLASVVQIVRVG